MAKRDFILKQDTNSAFIEKENRTTIMGIVAIVAIVLVVATFMKVADITPFSGLVNNAQGFATNAQTFFGEHTVALQGHDAVFAQVNVQGIGERTFYAYTDDGILIVDMGSHYVRVALNEEVPGVYSAQYPEAKAGQEVAVLVNAQSNQLTFEGLTQTQFPVVAGSTFTGYTGNLIVAGQEYVFSLLDKDLGITLGGNSYTVPLKKAANGLEGLWIRQEGQHEIFFNGVSYELTVTNLY